MSMDRPKDDRDDQVRLLAFALFQIRVLLAGHVSFTGDRERMIPADEGTRVAANLAYALHNPALAIMAGESFDLDLALKQIERVDRLLGADTIAALEHAFPHLRRNVR
ncbi:hypothetical protein [Tahibacter sp.]|uniref:hypothetical protein n=1 Tax=Tahibacter sp. TaxID=2056211 RepID=UPI0028C46B79|nr:hypothetical protein [Tahibacter sp.]